MPDITDPCNHQSAVITFYELVATDYYIQNGEFVEGDSEELEGEPQTNVNIKCQECSFEINLPDWQTLTEPFLSLAKAIRQQEYSTGF